MSLELARQLAHSLMFEGYVLYPYRQSSLKNQKRFVFGALYPASWAERAEQRSGVTAELLVRAASVRVQVLLLHWAKRTRAGEASWCEAHERALPFGPFSLVALAQAPEHVSFALPSSTHVDDAGSIASETISGALRLSAEAVAEGVFRLRLALQNRSLLAPLPGRDEAELAELMSFGAAHLLVHSDDGELLSLLEPPPALGEAARACRNDGVWPVLVGSAEPCRTALASPITLYDFPVVAPESPGDYYDATEIDEMLALRVRTMTESEKEQARRTDPRARHILERSEQLSDDELAGLHGTWREPAKELAMGPRPGEQVRLRPRPGRDVLDLALAGELATVISQEQDFEGRRFWTVTVDADPGRDLGLLGQPGHRFFFELEELERLEEPERRQ